MEEKQVSSFKLHHKSQEKEMNTILGFMYIISFDQYT